MKVHDIKWFKDGWFIGDFEPSLLKTKDFEVAIKFHDAGEDWPEHYHAIATEYNYLMEGEMIIAGVLIVPGELFVIEAGETVNPEFVEDCTVVTIKVPSIPGDKYVVHKS